jgi:hypothetical protein
MCKKKDNSELSSSQRVIGMILYFNDTAYGTYVLTYSGNLLQELSLPNTVMGEGSKTVFQYSGTFISSSTDYYKQNGNWIRNNLTNINGYSGDNPIEIVMHDYDDAGVEKSQDKTVYSYDGTLLKKMEEYSFQVGTWRLESTTIYTYDSKGRIIQEVDTTSSYYGNITTHSYDSDHRTESLIQEYHEGKLTNSGKITYLYTNNRYSGDIYYRWEPEAWIKYSEDQCEYNEFGNVSREIYQHVGSSVSMRVDITFGEGTGNYRQCMKVAGGTPVLPGDPYPVPVKSVYPASKRINLFIDK